MQLLGKRVLVVEDEHLVALSLEDNLRSLGYRVVGPATSLSGALQAAAHEPLDAAILDMNLAGESVLPAAAILLDRGIPFLFCSGYSGAGRLPERFADVPRVAKPYTSTTIAAALADLIDDDGEGGTGPAQSDEHHP